MMLLRFHRISIAFLRISMVKFYIICTLIIHGISIEFPLFFEYPSDLQK